MIAIACATTDERLFRARATKTIETLDGPGSLLLRRHQYSSFATAYDEMVEAAVRHDDLEAVVLLHEGTVIEREADVLAQLRCLLAVDQDIALVSAVDTGPARELVTADATLLALSPWAARNLRIDPAVGASADACAEDLSLSARASGRRVVGLPLGVTRVCPARLEPGERRRQLHALVELRRKWGPISAADAAVRA